MKKLVYICVLCSISLFSCKKDKDILNDTTQDISFEMTSFEIGEPQDELFLKSNIPILIYASPDTLHSQTKTIENLGEQRMFFLEEIKDFYKVSYLLYGEKPTSMIAYVRKEDVTFNDQHSLEFVNLYSIGYSHYRGILDEKKKTFEHYGTIKPISKELYLQNKGKGNLPFLTKAQDIVKNDRLQVYQFTTQSGENIEIPIEAIAEKENIRIHNKLAGYTSLIQSFVIQTTEGDETYYTLYSKRNTKTLPQYLKTLPIVNKNTQQFAQFYNDETGCIMTLYDLDDQLQFREQLLVNFTNFHVLDNSMYWVNDNSIIVQAKHPLQKDETKFEYLLIQLK